MPITESIKEKLIETGTDLNKKGMRVLGVAHKNWIEKEHSFAIEDESEMVLIGYLAFLDPDGQALFQSGWFIEGLLSQTLIVHMIRTRKIPFIQSRASLPVMITTFSIMAIGIIIPFTSLGASIGFTPLAWSYFPWLIGILSGYCFLTQIVKTGM